MSKDLLLAVFHGIIIGMIISTVVFSWIIEYSVPKGILDKYKECIQSGASEQYCYKLITK